MMQKMVFNAFRAEWLKALGLYAIIIARLISVVLA